MNAVVESMDAVIEPPNPGIEPVAQPLAVSAVKQPLTRSEQKTAYSDNKLEKRLCREAGRAIGDFNMIEDGDRVMVCLSGGKDSYGLLEVLLLLKQRAPVNFEIIAVNLDQKQPGFPEHLLPAYLKARGVEFHIEAQDTYSIVKRVIPEGKTTCGLCSRLRRGILYRVAGELKATKIALGHHQGDILETLFLNMFFNGRLKAMPPKLMSDDGKHIVIRPLAYVREADLERYAAVKQFPIIPCNLCGAQETLQRREVKHMLADWDKRFPGRIESIATSISNVAPSHLMDAKLFGFRELAASGVANADGDIAFDDEPCAPVGQVDAHLLVRHTSRAAQP